ncbi:arylsulfatase B-like [Hetaerina americana]|uniref:arylsulfatase B-like n=1 Tax=Hetaerina americana TaxID=62018 RepID=UPI003A7F3EB8
MGLILYLQLYIVLCYIAYGNYAQDVSSHPHIIIILADDLGWNDVGFHGSNQIPTPNIDALAYRGIILNNHYVQSLCTPSRSALMTGKYPIHLGMQHYVLLNTEPRGLPLSERLLPEYLKDLGYSTHAVGKWHLGFFKKEYTPEFRGFDSHFGHWTGQKDYYDHTAVYQGIWGMDLHRGLDPDWDSHGRYTTELYTEEALKVIDTHKKKLENLKLEHLDESFNQPLFLYLSHHAVHSGNDYKPLQAPDETVEKFSYIKDYQRRKYAAMLHWFDESVGKVVERLAANDMLNNSIILVATDNGGAPAGLDNNKASNWPLRGVKFSLWEGGVRGTALIWSPLLKRMRRVSEQMMHISDWVPTLLSAIDGSSKLLPGLDGYNMWKALSEDEPSERNEILLNIDANENESALRVGDWKLMIGTSTRFNGTWDDWYGPSGLDEKYSYDVNLILNSRVSKAMNLIGNHLQEEHILTLREKSKVRCEVDDLMLKSVDYDTENISGPPIACDIRVQHCLFNIKFDPCERRNLADVYPDVYASLLHNLAQINRTALPPANIPTVPQSNPALWGYEWTNYEDKNPSQMQCSNG